MFDFNPKYLLVIPATVIFYKLCQKEEINVYPYFEHRKTFNKSLEYQKILFEKPKLPPRRLKTRNKLFKIMDNEIKEREVKAILYNIIDEIVEKPKKKIEKKIEKKNTSYLSYFNISKFMRSKNDDLEKVSISSDGSYDKVSENSKFSDFSKISEFSKISDFSKISEIDIKE